jgi:hypothetical protein
MTWSSANQRRMDFLAQRAKKFYSIQVRQVRDQSRSLVMNDQITRHYDWHSQNFRHLYEVLPNHLVVHKLGQTGTVLAKHFRHHLVILLFNPASLPITKQFLHSERYFLTTIKLETCCVDKHDERYGRCILRRG